MGKPDFLQIDLNAAFCQLFEKWGQGQFGDVCKQAVNGAEDGKPFFLSEYPESSENAFEIRLPLYCKLYEAFEKGLKRASDKVKIGGPALARFNSFLGGFLDYVKANKIIVGFL